MVVAYCRSADENEVSTSLNTKQNPKSHLEFNFQGVFFCTFFGMHVRMQNCIIYTETTKSRTVKGGDTF